MDKKIAIINLKKSDGTETSDIDEIMQSTLADKAEILEEMRIIDPDVIVCGSTSSLIKEV